MLKPGGHYVFNVWGSWEENPFAEIAHNVVTAFFPCRSMEHVETGGIALA